MKKSAEHFFVQKNKVKKREFVKSHQNYSAYIRVNTVGRDHLPKLKLQITSL